MLARLPVVYALLLVAELVGLGAIYAIDMPASSDPLGMALGWGAIGSMVVLLVYSVARRVRRLREVAKLPYWLHFHIFLALQGVMWACFHASPILAKKYVAILNPGLLNLLIVLVVFGSGLFGRFLYGRLPIHGGERDTAARATSLQRVFGLWIVLHRPLAAVLYVLSAMHIVLSYMYSARLSP